MSDKIQSNPQNFFFYESIILILYLCVGFIPNLQAIDKIAPQWLFISGLNFIGCVFILKNKHIFGQNITKVFKSWITILYALFIFWAVMSFFYAINPTEVVVNFSRQFNVFFMFCNISILLSSIKNQIRFLTTVLAIILAVEVYFIIYEAIGMINSFGQISSGNLKGVTANRNIAAFSIAIKVPFVLFFIFKSKTRRAKILGLIIVTFSITSLSIIESRASYIAVGLIVIMTSITPFLFFNKKTLVYKLKTILYIFLPFILSVLINQIFFASKGADALSRASTISISTNDGSVNQRLRYYNHVFTHLKSNPLFGVGFGNWKFKSIDYDKKNINGYTVPYHAHSDFIQIGAELGILGFLLYAGIFITSIIYSFKLLFDSKFKKSEKLFIYFTLISMGVYLIDANLNFPIARPQISVILVLIISLISYFYIKHKESNEIKNKKYASKIILYTLLIVSLPCIFISFRVYDSLKYQMVLLSDFNSNKYDAKIEELEAMNMKIPNVTVTTIPLNSLKARYYLNQKKYDKALTALNSSKNANPFLYFTENLKSMIFQKLGNIDSAYYYSKKAFFGLPNNGLHSANFVKLAMLKKDKASIEMAAEQLLETQSPLNWQNIITAYIDIVGSGNKKLMELTEKSIEVFPKNYNFLLLRKLAHTNPVKIQNGLQLAREALTYFNEQNYKKASELYMKAIDEDPLEFSYYENIATCFYQLKEYGNAMLYSSKVIYGLNPGKGKSEYIHGISKIATGDVVGGCEFISEAINLNFKEALSIQKKYCSG